MKTFDQFITELALPFPVPKKLNVRNLAPAPLKNPAKALGLKKLGPAPTPKKKKGKKTPQPVKVKGLFPKATRVPSIASLAMKALKNHLSSPKTPKVKKWRPTFPKIP